MDDPPRSPASFIFMCERQMRLRAEYAETHTSSQSSARTDRRRRLPFHHFISRSFHSLLFEYKGQGGTYTWLTYAVQTMGGARGGVKQARKGNERVFGAVLNFYVRELCV